ncbi:MULTISPECIES: hypothetical protein [Rhodococcus]|jgi:hypothetical protein|uniref:hypothetical protein n=1 Tax=Rhodococcus TaxID=1827 RepID=UPI00071CA02D|nr:MULTISPECIES: hypothetical protein [Rhodococcus]ANQ75728.1 hypothetical protein AOT96_32520 [Rhodococcus sp. 008]KSU68398.1 hypothetical protein AS032_30975 [Rhodococcus qingshengii]SCC68817.1 hypothetical protein GA0061093_12633 [Rhodococcus qingshengii]
MDAVVRAESDERETWWREVMGVAAKGSAGKGRRGVSATHNLSKTKVARIASKVDSTSERGLNAQGEQRI